MQGLDDIIRTAIAEEVVAATMYVQSTEKKKRNKAE